jgi:hypothetical protein
VSPLNSRTTTKVAANSISKFGGILFIPIRLTAVECYASGLLKVRLSFKGQNVTPPPPKPLPNTDIYIYIYISPLLVTTSFSQLTTTVLTHLLLHYRLLRGSLWVEISTLACEANCSCCSARLSVAYCTHIIQTKLMLKNRRYPQNSMFTSTEGLTDMPLVVLG